MLKKTTFRLQIIDWMQVVLENLALSTWAESLTYREILLTTVLESRIHSWFLHDLRGDKQNVNSPIRWRDRISFFAQRILERGTSWLLTRSPTRAEFVFWPREFTHIEQQLPVARELCNAGYKVQFVACQGRIWYALWRQGERAVFAGKAWKQELKTARENGLKAVQQLKKTLDVKLPGLNEQIPSERVEGELRNLFELLLPDVYQYICNAESVLSTCKPKVLIVGNDLTLEGRAACLVARRSGVPTAAIMHGSVSGEPLHRLHVANRFLVYGQESRRELVNLGLKAEQVIACGAPYLDRRALQTGQPHPTLQRKLGLRPDQVWVLLAFSGVGINTSLDHHLLLLEAVARLSKKFPQVRFISKLHRIRDKLNYYAQVSQRVPGSHLEPVVYNTMGIPNDIYDWLQGCSLVITGASSVANEAMLMDVPVVTVDLMDEFTKVNFIDAGATYHVRREDELQKTVSDLLNSPHNPNRVRPKAKHYLTEYFGPLDRGSAKRCAQVIVDLAQIRQRPNR